MRVCVIGNSHVGSLKRAWELSCTDRSGVEMTFFAAPRNMLKDLVFDGAGLVPTFDRLRAMLAHTSGGPGRIEPARYDRFVIYGANLAPWFPPDGFHSGVVLSRAVAGHVTTTLSFKLLRQLRELTDGEVHIGHNPLPASRGDAPELHDATVSTRPYEEGVAAVNERILAAYGASMVSQPLDTIVGGRFTRADYGSDVRCLVTGPEIEGERYPEWDVSHMNEQFGRKWLRAYMGLVADRIPSTLAA